MKQLYLYNDQLITHDHQNKNGSEIDRSIDIVIDDGDD